MPEKFIVTSALPYINGVKHLGNLIGSLLPADVYARYLRLCGHDVLCICGTDEHGTPCELAALEEGLPVAEYAAKMHEVQKDIYRRFRLSFDYFGRTSSPENRQMTQHLFLKLWENGLITERVTRQLYSVEDRRFLPDRFVVGTCPKCGYEKARGDQCESCTRLLDSTDLKNPRSAISGSTQVEFRESKHLFLDLPKMADRVEAWVNTKPHWPKTSLSIAKKWLKEGLRERCITRDLEWGIPVPLDGYRDKVFYVWFDAPIGYIGISIEWAKSIGRPDRWQDYWKDPETKLYNFLAKDNIPFHAVTWPAVMMGADDGFILAEMVKGFQWLNYEGGKFSTSEARGVFTDDALDLFPADYWRYYLLSIAPEKGDTDFTWHGFHQAVNADLANALGNFVHRTLTFLHRYFGGKVPAAGRRGEADRAVLDFVKKSQEQLDRHMAACRFQLSVRALRDLWAECNRYFDLKAPWKEVKEDEAKAGVTLNVCAHLARAVAILTQPYLPDAAENIAGQLGIEEPIDQVRWEDALDFDCLTGRPIAETPRPLFQKIEDKQVAEIAARYAGAGSE